MLRKILWATACVALVTLCTPAGTREDIARLNQQVADLTQRLQQMESQMAALQKSVQDISARLDAVSRASQTADIRADLDGLKRQVEILSSQMVALKAQQESAPAISTPPAQTSPAPGGPTAPTVAPSAPPATVPIQLPPATSPDLYNQAYSDYLQGKYDLAAGEFRQFMDAFPQDARAGNSQYWIGECYYSQKKYADAKEAFQAVRERYPTSNKVLAASLKLGLTHLSLDETAQGVTVLKELIKAAPNSDEALIARDRLARLQAP